MRQLTLDDAVSVNKLRALLWMGERMLRSGDPLPEDRRQDVERRLALIRAELATRGE